MQGLLFKVWKHKDEVLLKLSDDYFLIITTESVPLSSLLAPICLLMFYIYFSCDYSRTKFPVIFSFFFWKVNKK